MGDVPRTLPARTPWREVGLADALRRPEEETELEAPDANDARRLGLALLDETAQQSLGGSNTRERWNAYADVPTQIAVVIPLTKISLNELLTLSPGALLVSEWPTTQDLPLLVGDVFLGTVGCEPAGDRLGIRVNSFDQPS